MSNEQFDRCRRLLIVNCLGHRGGIGIRTRLKIAFFVGSTPTDDNEQMKPISIFSNNYVLNVLVYYTILCNIMCLALVHVPNVSEQILLYYACRITGPKYVKGY